MLQQKIGKNERKKFVESQRKVETNMKKPNGVYVLYPNSLIFLCNVQKIDKSGRENVILGEV